jgi:hypothetical protein
VLVHPFLQLFAEPEPEEHDNNVPEHTHNGEATEQEDGGDADVEYKIGDIQDAKQKIQQRAYGWWMRGGACESLGEQG